MYQNEENKVKLCFLIREYFIQDVIRQPAVNAVAGPPRPFAKKTHYLEVVYLLIYYARGMLNPKEMENYFTDCLRPDRSVVSVSESLLNDVVRVWMYFIRPSDNSR
jgi:hypothetical protein